MGSSKFETTITRTIWNNVCGSNVVVKPDGDALGLVEVSGSSGSIVMYPDEARLVADAIRSCANDVTQAEPA